jgi:hypothetical protein
MPRAKVTDGLSEAAQAVMARGFADGRPAAFLARAVKDATGEAVSERTVSRRAAEWRAEATRRKAARERMADLVAAMKAGGMEASEMIQALAMDQLVEHPEALTGADPVELHGMSLDAEKVRLKRRELDIRERSVTVDERKLAMLEAREDRLKAAVEGGEKKDLTPEERLREVRSILGLREDSA